MEKIFYTVEEFCIIFDVSKKTAYQYIKDAYQGKTKSPFTILKIGHQFLIAKKELDDIVGGEGIEKRIYTASDLCDILRMNKSSVYRFLKRAEMGKEPFTVIKIKSKYCIPVKNFHKFLNI